MEERHHFASDNTAAIAPEVFAALQRANEGFTAAYGRDAWTLEACDLLRELFETDCQIFFTFNGTAANALAVASLCKSYEGVVCHELAHLHTHECGAPEFFSNGAKLLLVNGELAKVTARSVEQAAARRSDAYSSRPRVLSITQPTELGTTYKRHELEALSDVTRRHGLSLHVDGARFLNAVAELGTAPAELSWKRGIDVLCLGVTKLGAPLGEAVIFFDQELARDFGYRCKQAGQLASKMRFLAAGWVGMLRDGTWLRHARHANACARRLAELLRDVPGIEIAYPVECNAVFAKLPSRIAKHLHSRGWRFSKLTDSSGAARFVCSWQTVEEDIDALLSDIHGAI
jgi:threonine aldolase